MLNQLLEQDRIKNLLIELLNPGFFNTENPKRIARVIADWHNIPEKKKGKRVKIHTLSFFVAPESIGEVFYDLWAILHQFTTYIQGVYVHGSYATGDFVESSDLDLVYIVTNESARDAAALMQIREGLLGTRAIFDRIDPHQHHGPYILTPKIIRNYLESYLPLEVWRKSRPVWGPQRLKFYVQDCRYHNVIWFERSRKYYTGEIPLLTAYDRKRYVCMACMIPCVAYPYVTGKYTDKVRATEWFAREYPESKEWILEIQRRRIENDYDNLNDFVKATVEVLEVV